MNFNFSKTKYKFLIYPVIFLLLTGCASTSQSKNEAVISGQFNKMLNTDYTNKNKSSGSEVVSLSNGTILYRDRAPEEKQQDENQGFKFTSSASQVKFGPSDVSFGPKLFHNKKNRS